MKNGFSKIVFCLMVLVAFILPIAQPANALYYTVTDLGALCETAEIIAYGINDRGQVVGECNSHAFIWSPEDGYTNLASLLPGESISRAFDVNNQGQVVGTAWLAPGVPAVGNRAFLWSEEDGMTVLDTLGGNSSGGHAINDLGQMVGTRTITSPVTPTHAFLWTQDSGMIDFGTLEGTYHGLPWDINEAGEVVGICRNETPTREDHACLWREDTGWIDLGRLSEDANSQAKSMNNRGVVVGRSELTSGHRHPFLWTEKDGMVDLGALHEWPNNMAHGINEHNQVVGRSYNFDGNGSGFMWTTHTGMVELDPLWVWIDGYWFDGSEANDINELGQIVGISFDTYMEYRKRAVVWTPNPLPNIGSHHTEFTISGSGFGDKEGKVLIDGKKLKVLEWSDTSIRCRIKQNCKNMEPGVYDLIIIPKEPKGAETIVMEEAFIFAGIED